MRTTLSFLILSLVAPLAHAGGPLDPKFYTSDVVQRSAPRAFALRPESREALYALDAITIRDGDALFEALSAEPALKRDLQGFGNLALEQQVRVLRKVFEIQTRLSGRRAPELSLDENFARGAFFEFDPARPSPGKVTINPKLLGQDAYKLSSLALLIHETRHSEQFQIAFLPRNSPAPAYATGYAAAFRYQKSQEGKDSSFLNFMTMLNEYEAFRFGNYVVGRLTDFQIDAPDMGSFASQFKIGGLPKIQLTDLVNRFGYPRLVERFHALEEEQYRILKR